MKSKKRAGNRGNVANLQPVRDAAAARALALRGGGRPSIPGGVVVSVRLRGDQLAALARLGVTNRAALLRGLLDEWISGRE